MQFFHLISILIVIAAAFAYINFRFLKLPTSIGLMFISLLFSISIIVAGQFLPGLKSSIESVLNSIDFSELLLEVMLSFMLFAGAIHIQYKDLKKQKLSILLFATVSVIISTFIIGFATYYILNWFGIPVKLLHALLFGTLISPTDPIAVLSILKSAGIPKSLETKIAGESLFNDGVAVVIFITVLQLSKPGADISIPNIAILFGKEALGGILLGIVLGYAGYKLIASINNYQVEVLITLAIVMGGYTMAHSLHVSGPLAMVAAGLITGNRGKELGMSYTTADYMDKFWELIDEMLNALLFVLIGLELLIIKINIGFLVIGPIFIVLSLLSRYISLWIPSLVIRWKEKITRKTLFILTWGGLRGGISIALALSIPAYFERELWVTLAYIIVCFTIIVQGLTIQKVTR